VGLGSKGFLLPACCRISTSSAAHCEVPNKQAGVHAANC